MRALLVCVFALAVAGEAFGQSGGIPAADVTVSPGGDTMPFPAWKIGGGGRGASVNTPAYHLVHISFYCRAIPDVANIAGAGQSAASLTYTFYGAAYGSGATPVGQVARVENFGGTLTREKVWAFIDDGYSGARTMKYDWMEGVIGQDGRDTQALWIAFKNAVTTGDTTVLCNWANDASMNQDASDSYWEQDPSTVTPSANCTASTGGGGGGGPSLGGGTSGGLVTTLCGGPNQPPCPGTCDVPGKPCCDRDRDGCCDVDDPEPDNAHIDCGGCNANFKATWDNIIGTVRTWGVDMTGLTCTDCQDIKFNFPMYLPDGAGGWAAVLFPIGIMPDSSFVAYDAAEAFRQVCRGMSLLAFLVMFMKHLWIAVRTTI